MYEKLEQCPSCNFTSFSPHLIVTDHLVTNETFAISKCDNCELLFTNPRPVEKELTKYYDSNQYLSHHSSSLNPISIVYRTVRKINLARKLQWVKTYSPNIKTLLDFGCGTGNFLALCEEKGLSVSGVELDDDARNRTKSIITGPASSSLESLNPDQKFDAITAWHVLEHVSQLNSTIEKLKTLLNKKGHLFIALPNHKSFDSDYYKEKWAGYDIPRHLYHFDKTSIKFLLSKHSLKIKKVLPMKFDAFYVSLLSEKYLQRSPLINAIKTGINSNKQAKSTGEFSSLVYVVKHA